MATMTNETTLSTTSPIMTKKNSQERNDWKCFFCLWQNHLSLRKEYLLPSQCVSSPMQCITPIWFVKYFCFLTLNVVTKLWWFLPMTIVSFHCSFKIQLWYIMRHYPSKHHATPPSLWPCTPKNMRHCWYETNHHFVVISIVIETSQYHDGTVAIIINGHCTIVFVFCPAAGKIMSAHYCCWKMNKCIPNRSVSATDWLLYCHYHFVCCLSVIVLLVIITKMAFSIVLQNELLIFLFRLVVVCWCCICDISCVEYVSK